MYRSIQEWDDYYTRGGSYPDCDPSDYMEHKCEYQEKLHTIENAFLDIVDILYGEGTLDLGKLDDRLGEMADTLDVKWVVPRLPSIERRKSQIHKFAIELAQVQKAG